jgi:hypothetical protein
MKAWLLSIFLRSRDLVLKPYIETRVDDGSNPSPIIFCFVFWCKPLRVWAPQSAFGGGNSDEVACIYTQCLGKCLNSFQYSTDQSVGLKPKLSCNSCSSWFESDQDHFLLLLCVEIVLQSSDQSNRSFRQIHQSNRSSQWYNWSNWSKSICHQIDQSSRSIISTGQIAINIENSRNWNHSMIQARNRWCRPYWGYKAPPRRLEIDREVDYRAKGSLTFLSMIFSLVVLRPQRTNPVSKLDRSIKNRSVKSIDQKSTGHIDQ